MGFKGGVGRGRAGPPGEGRWPVPRPHQPSLALRRRSYAVQLGTSRVAAGRIENKPAYQEYNNLNITQVYHMRAGNRGVQQVPGRLTN